MRHTPLHTLALVRHKLSRCITSSQSIVVAGIAFTVLLLSACDKKAIPPPSKPGIKSQGVEVAKNLAFTLRSLHSYSDIVTMLRNYRFSPALNDTHSIDIEYWLPAEFNNLYSQRLAKCASMTTNAMFQNVQKALDQTAVSKESVPRKLVFPSDTDYSPEILDSLSQKTLESDTVVWSTTSVDSPWTVRCDTFFNAAVLDSEFVFDTLLRTRTTDTMPRSGVIDKELWVGSASKDDADLLLRVKRQFHFSQGEVTRYHRSLINKNDTHNHGDSISITGDTLRHVYTFEATDPSAQWWYSLDSSVLHSYSLQHINFQNEVLLERYVKDTTPSSRVVYDFTDNSSVQSVMVETKQNQKKFGKLFVADSTSLLYKFDPDTTTPVSLVSYHYFGRNCTGNNLENCNYHTRIKLHTLNSNEWKGMFRIRRDPEVPFESRYFGPVSKVIYDYDVVIDTRTLEPSSYTHVRRTDYCTRQDLDSVVWTYTPETVSDSNTSQSAHALKITSWHTPRSADSSKITQWKLYSASDATDADSITEYTWVGRIPQLEPSDTLTYRISKNNTTGAASYQFTNASLQGRDTLFRKGRIEPQSQSRYRFIDTLFGTSTYPVRIIDALIDTSGHGTYQVMGIDTFMIKAAQESLHVHTQHDTISWYASQNTYSAVIDSFEFTFAITDENTISGSLTGLRGSSDIYSDDIYVSAPYSGSAKIYGVTLNTSSSVFVAFKIALWHQNILSDSIVVY